MADPFMDYALIISPLWTGFVTSSLQSNKFLDFDPLRLNVTSTFNTKKYDKVSHLYHHSNSSIGTDYDSISLISII